MTRAVAQLDKWERAHTDQTELKSLLAEIESLATEFHYQRQNDGAGHAAGAHTDGNLQAVADVTKLIGRRLEAKP